MLVAFRSRVLTATSAAQKMNAAATFTDAEMNIAQAAVITANTNGLVLLERGDVTATFGHSIAQGESGRIDGNTNILASQFIRSGGTDCTATVTLYAEESSVEDAGLI